MASRGVRHVIVLRHAKSMWPDGVDDLDRPLAKRGRRDAPVAGRWLRKSGNVPEFVVCSPARRTRDTWELVSGEWTPAPPVVYDERVYAAGAASLVEVLRETPEDVRSVMLIGHNPGVQELVLSLAGRTFDDALVRVREKFPTSGIAVLEIEAAWPALAGGGARLVDFVVPRGHRP